MTISNDLSRIQSETTNHTARLNTPTDEPSLIDGATIVTSALQTSDTGIIVSWLGRGDVSISHIQTALESAGFESGLAPSSKSLVAILGSVMGPIAGRGRGEGAQYSVSRSKVPTLDKETGTRSFCAQYKVTRIDKDSAVKESAGLVGLVAELRDGDSKLYVRTDESNEMIELRQRIELQFNTMRDNETLKAGDFSLWLRQTLVQRFGATRVGALGWFVPSLSKDSAKRFVDAMKPVSGTGWVVADITTSEGLMEGIFDSFCHEVDEMEAALDREYQLAQSKGKDDVSERVATRYVTALRELSDRAVAYTALCGPDTIQPVIRRVTEMKVRLESVLGSGTDLRFSLLDLAVEADDDTADDHHYGPAQRAADEALARRHSDRFDQSESAVEVA